MPAAALRQGLRLACGLAAALCLALPATAQSPVPPAGASSPVPPAGGRAPATAPPQQAAAAEAPDAIRVLLAPDLETTLVSQMVGRVASLRAELGGRVQKGGVLVAFDCAEMAARLSMARAEYAQARETLEAKQRLRQLDAAGDVEVSLAAAGADKARAAIALSQAQMAHCTVAAPFTGRVVRIHVKPHQGVNVGAPLLELISDGPLKLRLNVPSAWLRQVRVGTPFEVDINETGRSYPAKVTRVNARVDAVARTIELEARMDKAEPDLLAGMSGVARFRIAR